MKVFRGVTASLLIPTLAVLPGCSAFQPHTQQLTIMPSDPQAEVFVNGKPVGQGTVVVDLRRGPDYSVMARVGDRAGTATVGHRISGTGVADLIGGFLLLVPFIGCFTPGFWDLDPQRVSIAVPPAPTYAAPSSYAPSYNSPARGADAGTRPQNDTGSRLPPVRGNRSR